jgi:hypothetical protein
MRAILALLVSLTAFLPSGMALAQAPADPAAAIRELLSSAFEKPGSALYLDPIVIEGDAAIVGWTQGDMAGRAFLRARHGQWTIVACGGDALKAAATLQRLGLPQAPAERLAASLVTAEAVTDPKRVARFATFGELMQLDGQPHPPPTTHRH